MALISCPECGTQVSDKAARCPQCGHPIHVHKSHRLHDALQIGWMGIAVISLIVLLFMLLGTCHFKSVL